MNQLDFEHSENINELATALSKAQGEMTSAKKDSINPHFKSKYADLSSVWDACREPLFKNGLAVIQITRHKEGKIEVVTMLTHSSGQWIKSFLPVIMTKQDAQGLGSSLTYSRRYALSAIVGVAPDDDDGEASIDRRPKPAVKFPTADEVDVFKEELNKCPADYRDKILKFINDNYQNNLSTIPCDVFNKMNISILKKIMTEVSYEKN